MNDKVVLITGGAGNLGRAVTQVFLEAGARVAVPLYKTDRQNALDELSARFREKLHHFALDLTTERGAEQAVRRVIEWAGRLDSVVHLIGGYTGGARVADTPLDAWERMVNLNMTSAFLISRFAIPHLVANGGGSFVFVSARAAFEGRKQKAAYATTKAGLIALAEAIGEEYASDGIRSNVIVPDTIDTEANRRALPDADHDRWTGPAEVAHVILFLASERASAINQATIPVYGAH